MSNSNVQPPHDITPYDCTPGRQWEDFVERLHNLGSGEVNDRGWSVSDHLLTIDELGATGPPAV